MRRGTLYSTLTREGQWSERGVSVMCSYFFSHQDPVCTVLCSLPAIPMKEFELSNPEGTKHVDTRSPLSFKAALPSREHFQVHAAGYFFTVHTYVNTKTCVPWRWGSSHGTLLQHNVCFFRTGSCRDLSKRCLTQPKSCFVGIWL